MKGFLLLICLMFWPWVTAFAEDQPGFKVSGVVYSITNIMISSEVEGQVISVLEVGDVFKSRDLLAQIDSDLENTLVSELKKQIRLLKTWSEKNRTFVDKYEALATRNAVSSEELLEQLSQFYEVENTVIELTKEISRVSDRLGNKKIEAPFDGVVLDRFVAEKEVVDKGTRILNIVNPKKLRVLAQIPYGLRSKLDFSKATWIDSVGTESTLLLDYIGENLDPASNTFEVSYHLPDARALVGQNITLKVLFLMDDVVQ